MHNTTHSGTFVISLDFELMWGVWDVTTKEKYGKNIIGVKEAIPKMLALFKEYDIAVTFATVGFLFAENRKELVEAIPTLLPNYSNEKYNVYKNELSLVGDDENDDPYHFGFSLLRMIKDEGKHEICTHTFSHYYCLEEGQSLDEFKEDINAAKEIAAKKGIEINSIIFPRNQVNEDYLCELKKMGIYAYRGNPTSWIYKPRKYSAEILFIRLCRLLDSYLPISGYNSSIISNKNPKMPINIPASRFLKPFDPPLRCLESLRLNRIKNEMTHAAKNNKVYHLWWHPHNFGINLEENILFLTKLFNHYKFLESKYRFSNTTMLEKAMVC